MKNAVAIIIVALFIAGCASTNKGARAPAYDEPLLAVTPIVAEYSIATVYPLLEPGAGRDTLTQLLMVSNILADPTNGIGIHRMDPGRYMVYDKLSNVGLGFLSTAGLSPAQKNVLRLWHKRYMQDNPADVFFAPSADEIIKSRAAFGCTHYARAFMAVVKALGLITRPDDLRYVISSKADDYNRALERKDYRATINGHQFVMVRIGSRWIAINTSKGESTEMAPDFSPDSCTPPHNTPIRFQAYPDVVFLIRRIGTDWNDDCRDNSLSSLMNISRSGKPDDPSFLWDRFDLPSASPESKENARGTDTDCQQSGGDCTVSRPSPLTLGTRGGWSAHWAPWTAGSPIWIFPPSPRRIGKWSLRP